MKGLSLKALALSGRAYACALCLVACAFLSSCATIKPTPTQRQEIEDARKVMEAMTNQDISDADLKRVVMDVRTNEESRDAVGKILGQEAQGPVVKYSPVTGKHYSGDLEFDPETGAKLEMLTE